MFDLFVTDLFSGCFKRDKRPPFKGDQSRSRILEEAGRWWFRKGSTVKKGMIAGKMGCTWNTRAVFEDFFF